MVPEYNSRGTDTHISHSRNLLAENTCKLQHFRLYLSLPFASAAPSTSLPESEQIAQLTQQLQWVHLTIQLLEERLRLERIKKYGPGSEKLNSAQLDLLDLEPGVSNVEIQAEGGRAPLPAQAKSQNRRKHPDRKSVV